MTTPQFADFALSAQLKDNLAALGYQTPSPIQAKAIPPLLEGRDLMGCAQTGTGKTAAFALPILHQIMERPARLQRGTTRALILAPTRELVVQVAESFAKYGKGQRFRLATVYGGVSQRPQVNALNQGLDVLVATPGRLLDLREQGYLNMRGVEFFVLDEADRMLDMGFFPDIQKIVRDIPADRQTCFFSATFEPRIAQLANTLLRNPISVSVNPENQAADKVKQNFCFIERGQKQQLLEKLLADGTEQDSESRVLVFSKTRHGTEKLAKLLVRRGIGAESIHGDKSQAARQKALERFREGRSPVLVATDVAARGLDVRNITMVINYDLPMEPESYIHRIGRTARAGASGEAWSFCGEEDLSLLRQIERLLKKDIIAHEDHDWHASHLHNRFLQPGPIPGQQKGPGRGGRKVQTPRRGPGASVGRSSKRPSQPGRQPSQFTASPGPSGQSGPRKRNGRNFRSAPSAR